ncbi:MAG TPA: DUF3105 domain-containing protein [Conexibacter sp.]|jgi:hypothetical protein|nr:DUF3105 domain-containing protein [Conexibacter sp.]
MSSARPSPTPSHRRLRQLGVGLITLVVALGGVVLLLLFLQARDHSQLRDETSATRGPGTLYPDQGHAHLRAGERPPQPYASDPPTSGAHVPAAIRSDGTGTRLSDDQILHALELGNVVLLYGTRTPPAALRALAQQLTGSFDPALAANGAAVVLGFRPGAQGVIALAWRHMLRTPSAADPAIAEFADYWLGRGAP